MKNVIAFLVAAGLVISFLMIPVIAQDVGSGGIGGRPAYPREGNERSQSIFIHTLENGESVEDGVNIINNTNERKTVVVYSADGQVSSGGAFACEQRADPINDSGSWITLDKDRVTLDSAGNEIVDFTITVPQNADVGEHNACIVVQEEKPETQAEQGIGLSFRTAIRVAILVPGEINKSLEIESLNASSEPDKVVLTPAVSNSGNVSVDTNMVSKLQTLWSSDVSEVGGQYPVLRGQRSEWNFRHNKPFWGGWYKTYVETSYDQSPDTFLGESAEDTVFLNLAGPVVFVWPQPPAALIIVLVVTAVLYLSYRLIEKYKTGRTVKNSWKPHTVKKGEDLKYYSKATGVNWRTIAKANKIKPPYSLKSGQKIKLPPKKSDKS